ncbi:MAG TPA: hypothetical protein VF550_19685 [Polyangia bacterium]
MRIYPKLIVLLGIASAVVLLGESSAFAQRPYYGRGYGPQPGYRSAPAYGSWNGYHQHDGFYMRVYAGPGYLTASETAGGVTGTYSDWGVTYGAAFGGTIAPNLILYGEFLGTTITDATFSSGGALDYPGYDLTLFGFGPGIAYYFEPVNLYLSGTLTFTQIDFSYTGTSAPADSTNLGIGFSFMVGKEWWVTPDWGIGIAGQFHIATMRDPTYDTRMRATAFSILFSATYN